MHALALAKPLGWQIMMAGAKDWLLQQQTQDGYWAESGTPDPVYLTVLVLDAINLAAQPMGPVTFGRQSGAPGVRIRAHIIAGRCCAGHCTAYVGKHEGRAASRRRCLYPRGSRSNRKTNHKNRHMEEGRV